MVYSKSKAVFKGRIEEIDNLSFFGQHHHITYHVSYITDSDSETACSTMVDDTTTTTTTAEMNLTFLQYNQAVLTTSDMGMVKGNDRKSYCESRDMAMMTPKHNNKSNKKNINSKNSTSTKKKRNTTNNSYNNINHRSSTPLRRNTSPKSKSKPKSTAVAKPTIHVLARGFWGSDYYDSGNPSKADTDLKSKNIHLEKQMKIRQTQQTNQDQDQHSVVTATCGEESSPQPSPATRPRGKPTKGVEMAPTDSSPSKPLPALEGRIINVRIKSGSDTTTMKQLAAKTATSTTPTSTATDLLYLHNIHQEEILDEISVSTLGSIITNRTCNSFRASPCKTKKSLLSMPMSLLGGSWGDDEGILDDDDDDDDEIDIGIGLGLEGGDGNVVDIDSDSSQSGEVQVELEMPQCE